MKNKKQALEKLKAENSTLTNIYSMQLKSNSKLLIEENETEKEMFVDKLKKLKTEFRSRKESNRGLEAKVKEQTNNLMQMEDKCKKLKDKIEAFKNKAEEETDNNGNAPSEKEMIELEESILATEHMTQTEEKQFKEEIAKQKQTILTLNQRVFELSKTIKERSGMIRGSTKHLAPLNKKRSNSAQVKQEESKIQVGNKKKLSPLILNRSIDH